MDDTVTSPDSAHPVQSIDAWSDGGAVRVTEVSRTRLGEYGRGDTDGRPGPQLWNMEYQMSWSMFGTLCSRVLRVRLLNCVGWNSEERGTPTYLQRMVNTAIRQWRNPRIDLESSGGFNRLLLQCRVCDILRVRCIFCYIFHGKGTTIGTRSCLCWKVTMWKQKIDYTPCQEIETTSFGISS